MTRDVDYKINVLRGGAVYAQVSWPTSEPPSIDVDKNADIKSSMSAVIYPQSDLDLLSDELQPVITVDGVSSPLGVFRAATVSHEYDEFGHVLRVEAYDRCWRVQLSCTENILHFASNTPYLTAIQRLLVDAGITMILATPSSAVLTTDREDWDPGTDYLTICNELLAEINYKSIWFDANGVCRLEPDAQPNSADIRHKYSGTDIRLQPIADARTQETDLFSTPNVFIRICSNPDLPAPLAATAVNDSPTSGTSTLCRKMRILSVETINNVASQAELQAIVDKLRNDSMFATKTITFYSLNEADHGVGDVISIDDADIGGIYTETAWSMTLAAGELMAHSAKRTVIA